MHSDQNPSTQLIIISGPAGSGKTTLCDRLLEKYNSVARMVTTTSRRPRPGEVDGIDYHFLSFGDFKKGIDEGEFIEWALVHGRYYGSQSKHVLKLLNSGKDILFNIDVQGAETFRKEISSDVRFANRIKTLFVRPPSSEEIVNRLKDRGTDSDEEIARRLKSAEEELLHAHKFDFIIDSKSKEEDFRVLEAIYREISGIAH